MIHVYYFRVKEYTTPECTFEIACTKGTYIRSLAHDLGKQIGCGAYLKTLRRTVSGEFNVKDAKPLKDILDLDLGALAKTLIAPTPQAGSR